MIDVDKLCKELEDKYDLPLKAEHDQVSLYKKIQTALVICIFAAFVINAIVMIANQGNFNIFGVVSMMVGLVIAVVIVMVIFSFLTRNKVEAYNRKYADTVGRELLNQYFENVYYHDGDQFGFRSIYKEAGYKEHYDISHSRRQMDLVYKGHNIKLMDILLEEETTDQDGNTHTYTVFNGLLLEIEGSYGIGTKMSITKNRDIGVGKNKLEMDSKEFEDFFNVYTDDKVKSMQLLTAEVMERFKEMYGFSKNGFDVTFNNGKLYLRLYSSGHMFDYGTEEVIEKEYITKDLQTLYLITAILDNIDYAIEANHVL